MFLYHQDSGVIRDHNGKVVGQGYSGHGVHKNDHLSQNIVGEGPIPVGVYYIGEPRVSAHTGKYVLPLTPITGDEMFGRSAFEMHGENVAHPGDSSDGCIVADLVTRELIGNSDDVLLAVLPPLS